jgi:hypothetical protein
VDLLEHLVWQLCVSYINLYEPHGVRKQILADTKHFDCSCIRCSEPLKSSIDRFLEVWFNSLASSAVTYRVKLSSCSMIM